MATAPTSFSSLAVLVVDDDAATRALVTRMLLNMGVKFVQQAANGPEALALIRSQRPHLVICDVEMEPMSGIEVLKALRKSPQSNERTLPFIVLTRHSDPEIVSAARHEGCNAFLLKPVSPDKLRERMTKALQQ
jgi:two-component system chemotaxis response regulator CheY